MFYPLSHLPQTAETVYTRLSCIWEPCETRATVVLVWLPCFKKRECRNTIWTLPKSVYCLPKDWSACPQLLDRNKICIFLLLSIGCHNYFSDWYLIIWGTICFGIIWFLSSMMIFTSQFVFHCFCQCLLSFRKEHCRVVWVYGSPFLRWYGLFGRWNVEENDKVWRAFTNHCADILQDWQLSSKAKRANFPGRLLKVGLETSRNFTDIMTYFIYFLVVFCCYVTAGVTHKITLGKNFVFVAVHVT